MALTWIPEAPMTQEITATDIAGIAPPCSRNWVAGWLQTSKPKV